MKIKVHLVQESHYFFNLVRRECHYFVKVKQQTRFFNKQKLLGMFLSQLENIKPLETQDKMLER